MKLDTDNPAFLKLDKIYILICTPLLMLKFIALSLYLEQLIDFVCLSYFALKKVSKMYKNAATCKKFIVSIVQTKLFHRYISTNDSLRFLLLSF